VRGAISRGLRRGDIAGALRLNAFATAEAQRKQHRQQRKASLSTAALSAKASHEKIYGIRRGRIASISHGWAQASTT
jgi:hypothetical protein